jgi:hypothetical protein
MKKYIFLNELPGAALLEMNRHFPIDLPSRCEWTCLLLFQKHILRSIVARQLCATSGPSSSAQAPPYTFIVVILRVDCSQIDDQADGCMF